MFGFSIKRLIKREIRKALSPSKKNTSFKRKTVVVRQSATVSETIVSTTPFSGKCHVIDGDTIVVRGQKIRFAGVNAPELNEAYGQKAKWGLVKLCKGKEITVHPNGETSYDRIVATCFLPDGTDLGGEMIRLGMALDLPKFSGGKYQHLETNEARRSLKRRPYR